MRSTFIKSLCVISSNYERREKTNPRHDVIVSAIKI